MGPSQSIEYNERWRPNEGIFLVSVKEGGELRKAVLPRGRERVKVSFFKCIGATVGKLDRGYSEVGSVAGERGS